MVGMDKKMGRNIFGGPELTSFAEAKGLHQLIAT
jgi:hypothetical protein